MGSKTNGAKNYNLSRIDIDSKEIAKKLGLTYNKKISEDSTSEETSIFEAFVKESVKGFNADTTTPANLKLYQIAQTHRITIEFGKIPKGVRDPKPPKAPKEPKPKPEHKDPEEPTVEPKPAEVHVKPAEVPVKPAKVPVKPLEVPVKPAEVAEIPNPKHVNQYIKDDNTQSDKDSLTDEQWEALLRQDKAMLKSHPAILQAYRDLVK
jgi:hypothetical protein